MTTIAIIGSRDYSYPERVVAYVNSLPDDTVVISGGARGVDRIAAQAARARGLEVIEIPAQWVIYGRGAGMIRNREVVNRADTIVAFWDGKSPGTRHAIAYAHKMKKGITVYD